MGKKEPAVNGTVVEQAIEKVGGSPGELARKLSESMGEEVSRQRVNGWRGRGIFPREVMGHVSKVCKIPLSTLVEAKPADRESGNIVSRAIRALGVDSSPAKLAAAISKESEAKVTRQMVNGWLVRNQFPLEFCLHVHLITKIPVKQLVKRRTNS